MRIARFLFCLECIQIVVHCIGGGTSGIVSHVHSQVGFGLLLESQPQALHVWQTPSRHVVAHGRNNRVQIGLVDIDQRHVSVQRAIRDHHNEDHASKRACKLVIQGLFLASCKI